MNIDKATLDKAREWPTKVDTNLLSNRARAAVQVIEALPDEWIDADKLQEALDWRDSKPSGDDYDAEFYNRLRALLPTPKPRTLADMSPEEREACQWMQADVSLQGETRRVVITRTVDAYKSAEVIGPGGFQLSYDWALVTPLPELPRMVWPSAEPGIDEPQGPQPTYAPGGVLEDNLDKPNQPQAGEAWRVQAHNVTLTAVLDNIGDWNGVDDNGRYHCVKTVTPLYRLGAPDDSQATPRTVTTEGDYESAVCNTVVRRSDDAPAIEKVDDGTWWSTEGHSYHDDDMAGTSRTVLWEPKA